MTYEIKTRDVEDRLVLTESRHGPLEGLDEFVPSAIGRRLDRAAELGGLDGHVFVIFHGKVGPGESATVEVCAPVAAEQSLPASEPHRIEKAHREAFVRLPKHMNDFPKILEGYSMVEEWIKANGHTFAGSPREVYFTDFMAAGPDDEVFDIAFPIK
jgi:hypothetical protein